MPPVNPNQQMTKYYLRYSSKVCGLDDVSHIFTTQLLLITKV